MEIKTIINLPISELGLSREFNQNCERMGINTLKDILTITPTQLIATPGFDNDWLGELVQYLSENQLLHYLQPMVGGKKEEIANP